MITVKIFGCPLRERDASLNSALCPSCQATLVLPRKSYKHFSRATLLPLCSYNSYSTFKHIKRALIASMLLTSFFNTQVNMLIRAESSLAANRSPRHLRAEMAVLYQSSISGTLSSTTNQMVPVQFSQVQ